MRAPADVVDSGDRAPEPPPIDEPGRMVRLLLSADAWVAVGVIAAILLVLFVVGMKLTR